MPGNPGLIPTLADDGINPILRLDLQDGPWRYTMQVNSALDLRLDHLAVNVVAQVGIWRNDRRECRVSICIGVVNRQSLNSPT